MMDKHPDLEWIKGKPEYLDIMINLIEYEEYLDPMDDDSILDRHKDETGRDYDVRWDNTDTPFDPNKLYQLEKNGFLDRVFDTNSTTMYSIVNRDDIKNKLEDINRQYNEGTQTIMHDFPSEEELKERGIFDDVVGYENVKFIMRRAMSSEDIVNILMIGPPGSAKTVFLMSINKLERSSYVSGDPTTGPGLMDKMFKEKPRFIAIDELDNMSKDDQQILADYTETGMLIESKGNNKQRGMRTNTKTFAAANNQDDILDDIQNRFIDLHFEPYTHDEFIEVCEHIITSNQDKRRKEARKIGEAVWEMDGFGNVRKALQTSRLSKGDPEKVLGVLSEYSQKGGLTGL